MNDAPLAGYTYGTDAVAPAALTEEEFDQLKACVGFAPEDVQALKDLGAILAPHVDELLDVWLNPILQTPFLARYYGTESGEIDPDYYAPVRARFGQWILDTCTRTYDRQWLDYQAEIGRRHHRVGKNRTDGAHTTGHIPLRFMIAVIYPITAAIEPFLARAECDEAAATRMRHAWFKSVCLQLAIWCQPYANPGDY